MSKLNRATAQFIDVHRRVPRVDHRLMSLRSEFQKRFEQAKRYMDEDTRSRMADFQDYLLENVHKLTDSAAKLLETVNEELADFYQDDAMASIIDIIKSRQADIAKQKPHLQELIESIRDVYNSLEGREDLEKERNTIGEFLEFASLNISEFNPEVYDAIEELSIYVLANFVRK